MIHSTFEKVDEKPTAKLIPLVTIMTLPKFWKLKLDTVTIITKLEHSVTIERILLGTGCASGQSPADFKINMTVWV